MLVVWVLVIWVEIENGIGGIGRWLFGVLVVMKVYVVGIGDR